MPGGEDDGAPSADDAWKLSAAAAMGPFCAFLYAHQRGLTVKLFEAAYRSAGIPGLIGVPTVTLAMEKCVYDTVNCYQGKEKNAVPRGLVGPVTFPSGGHMLPSFSLLDTNVDGVYYRAPPSSAAAAAASDAAAACRSPGPLGNLPRQRRGGIARGSL